MRKPAYCICKNKGAHQLCDSTIQNIKHLSIFCGCTARFVSDLVGNPEDRFSRDTAQIMQLWSIKLSKHVAKRGTDQTAQMHCSSMFKAGFLVMIQHSMCFCHGSFTEHCPSSFPLPSPQTGSPWGSSRTSSP